MAKKKDERIFYFKRGEMKSRNGVVNPQGWYYISFEDEDEDGSYASMQGAFKTREEAEASMATHDSILEPFQSGNHA